MSLENIGGFIQALQQDAALKQRFQSTVATLPQDADPAPHIVAFARDEGHALETNDLAAFGDLLTRARNDQLTDAELDKVNGGIFGAVLNAGFGAMNLPGTLYGSLVNTQNGLDPSKREFWLGF
ncbi:Nif11 family protein [Oceanibaculum indicum]|uniref:Putative ribosomally synthesized peptide with nif11-like leader n=1 Tax=Oceanibaculum indicum TaxID=526216 RepID=A0A420WBR5_9PROT|nr:Nif11 family protein [Oceanibaculum indicum]RKQ68380.1 putative ribosomally synthesized peptide with nif11-like leader [Oceanibaculum indicum]